ncbi:hypothetical protein ACFZCY_39825 [Streptomyces sp. NPDC007983]|uniref:hypothetical protein n=1 Tax=Streptomyces sp. NPDC007983 TaxID=3364800 RepID=UPI0036E90567
MNTSRRSTSPNWPSERSGAISGYRAHLDPHALGLTFDTLVMKAVVEDRALPL